MLVAEMLEFTVFTPTYLANCAERRFNLNTETGGAAVVNSMSYKAGAMLSSLARWAKAHRIGLSLVIAASVGWGGAVWFMAPEKQLQRLAEGLDDPYQDMTEVQRKNFADTYLALERRYQGRSPSLNVLVSKRVSCSVFCTLEWNVQVMSYDGKELRLDDGITLSVFAGLEPFPADARPRLLPLGYLWRTRSWGWSVYRRRGIEGLGGVSVTGDFESSRPETRLSGAPEVISMLNLMDARMGEVIGRANFHNEVYPIAGQLPTGGTVHAATATLH